MKKKYWIGLLIAGLWLASIGLLLERELGGRRVSPADAGAPTTTSSSWLGLFLADGPRVGHVHLRRQPEVRQELEGVRLTMDLQLKMPLLGRDTDLHLAGVLWRATGGDRAEMDLTVDSADQTLHLRGQLADGELVAEVESGGETFPLRLPMESDVLLASGGFGASLGLPPLDVGDDVRLPSFDPMTLRPSTARVRCLAEETLDIGGQETVTRRLEVETGGLTSIAWVDLEGEVVRAETPVGLVLERLDPASLAATEAAGAAGSGAEGLLASTAVKPTGPKPFRGASHLIARLRIPGGELPPVPSDSSQVAGPDGALTVGVGQPRPAGSTRDLLATDPFVQSDHPRIVEQAESLTAGLGDPRQRAQAIFDWVYAEIEKVPVMSIPSALEVLESKRGDCNEHTVLYTALARAAGLPTRIAVGLVWSDELDGFYYHAWPEVLIDGAFLRLDPTLGQAEADATHIKLLEGGIESWPRLLPYLGQLEIDIEEVG